MTVPAGARSIDLSGKTVIPGHHRVARPHVLRRHEVHGRELPAPLSLGRRDDDPHDRQRRRVSGAQPQAAHRLAADRRARRSSSPGRISRARARARRDASALGPGRRAPHGALLGGGRRDVVQGVHADLARRPRRRDRRGAQARREGHRASLLGRLPRSGRVRHRRSSSTGCSRTRSSTRARSRTSVRQAATADDVRRARHQQPGRAAHDSGDGEAQGGDDVDAGRVRVLVAEPRAGRSARARRAVSGHARSRSRRSTSGGKTANDSRRIARRSRSRWSSSARS